VQVDVRRAGDWWAIETSVRGQAIFTQAKRLDQVEGMIHDACATLGIDIAADEVIEVVPRLPGADLATAAREASKTAAVAAAHASTSMRKAARTLQSQGLSVRDIGVMLDISPQRVSQLTREAATA